MSIGLKQRLTLFINPSLAKHAKAQAVLEDLTLTELIEKALLKYLPKEIILKKDALLIELDPPHRNN